MNTPLNTAVYVGKTDFPLRPTALDKNPVPVFERPDALGSFRVLDGPPYANGVPHLGHVLNKHLKDAVARANNLKGHNVEWRPGWDCHGLPLELAVEKLGAKRDDKSNFVSQARQFAQTQASLQRDVFMEQGWSADWDNPWHTQDFDMEAGTLEVLAQLLEKNALSVKFAALPWCPACQSTLSNSEQDERLEDVDSWLVPFVLENGQLLLSWTTTPWTLPLHQHLVVSPTVAYVALEKDNQLAWVSEPTANEWAERLGAQVSDQRCLGSDLQGVKYSSPWTTGRVCADEVVLDNLGCGVLHAVPGLSELDTHLAHKHNWTVTQHLSPSGKVLGSPMLAQNGTQAGKVSHRSVEDVYMSEFAQYSGWFFKMPFSQPVLSCWRHHTPLLTRATRQVFLELTADVRARAKHMVDQMSFSPEAGRARLQAAMQTRPHWCLSRQRTWGVPLALFLDKDTNQPHKDAPKMMRRVAQEVRTRGVEAWWSEPSSAWLGDVPEDSVERVDDVLDVWFDSACVPQLVGASDVVVEGTDQHRGWFQSCVWLAAALDAPLPFKHVATHGFVVDERGDKFSKSKGGDKLGKVEPWNSLSTDVVRVWAMMGSDGADKRWTAETVDTAKALLARFRGAVRFMLANATQDCPNLSWDAVSAWDRYWVRECQKTKQELVDLVSKAQFGEAVTRVGELGDRFSALALGSWKDRLYCAKPESAERRLLNKALLACLSEWGEMMEVVAPRMHHDAQRFWPKELDVKVVENEEENQVPTVDEKTPTFQDPENTPNPKNTKVTLGPAEEKEVNRVLDMRSALGPQVEVLQKSKKGGVGWVGVCWPEAPNWTGNLVADALGVGELVTMPHEEVDANGVGLNPALYMESPEKMQTKEGAVWLGLSKNPLCTRCRRASFHDVGTTVCKTCAKRCRTQ